MDLLAPYVLGDATRDFVGKRTDTVFEPLSVASLKRESGERIQIEGMS